MAFKFTEDTSHGLAKRIALFRMAQQEFPKALYTPVSSIGYDFTYFDAFAGEGYYDNSIEGKNGNLLQTPFGDPRMGSPLVVLQAIYQHIHEMEVKSKNGEKKSYFMEALVVLEESHKGRFKKLKSNVLRFIKTKTSGFNHVNLDDGITLDGNSFTIERKKDEADSIYYWNLTKAGTVKVNVQIELKNSKFEELNIDSFKDNKPMISFIDPIGYSNTPMSKVMQLLGIRKKVLLNFMVHSVNRFKEVPIQFENFNALFGDVEWKSFLPEEYKYFDAATKMKSLVDCYTQCAGKFYNNMKNLYSSSLKFLNLSVRKGSAQGKDKGFIYYLVFMATDLNSIATAKYALTCVAHEPALYDGAEDINDEELFFSDHHSVNLFVETDNENKQKKVRMTQEQKEKEAQYIYEKWRGRHCTFGKTKEWILLKTPLRIHSNVFRFLEKIGLLTVENAVHHEGFERVECPDIRKNKPFPAYVNVDHDDPDYPYHGKNYRNAWKLKFSDVEYEDAVRQATPKKRKAKALKHKMEEQDADETPYKGDFGESKCEYPAKKKLFHE